VTTASERLIRVERTARLSGATVCLIIGLIVLAGYAAAFEPAWRPLPQLPATHPVTAICLVLLGCGLLWLGGAATVWRACAFIAILVALALAIAAICDAIITTDFIARITPFRRQLTAQVAAGTPVHFSCNTAFAVFGLCIGIGALVLRRHAKESQIILFFTSSIPILAFVGYLDELRSFHQSMAPFTLIALAAVAIGALGTTASHGFLIGLLRDSDPARFARRLLMSSTVIILLIGCLATRLEDDADGSFLAYQTVALLAWTWLVVMVSAMRADGIERLRRQTQATIIRDAATDTLTGLLNRNRLDQLLAEPRSDPTRTAMLTIDVDRFRSANNALGTELGDRLLSQVAERLVAAAEGHRVVRAGGDEFVIFCNDISAADAMHLGDTVVAEMAVPFAIESTRQFRISGSVGVAHGSTEGAADLRDAADEAMFIAKQQGGNQAVAFVQALHEARMERIGIEQDLHRALNSDTELSLVYQPIISLRDRRAAGVEALARWTHPVRGAISPARFIAIAEDAGLFLELGRKLRSLAVKQAAAWRAMEVPYIPIMNLNVSPLELARSDLSQELAALIEGYGLRTNNFCLEVTEGSFSDERALLALQEARGRGFRIAMDDFGVGYSSLAQLPRLPLSSVKLDRSFLQRATENEDGLSLLATMVQLSHVLKLPVVAEGVETLKELDIVSACGCDFVQGFIFSRPLTPAQLEPLLAANSPWPAEPKAAALAG
jgi:diguanylate cyclase (GGDEF)-like protein